MNNFEPPAIPGPSGGNSNGNVRALNYQAAFGGTYTISPRSVFELRMAVGQTEGGKFPVFIGQPTVDKTYGITGLPDRPALCRRPLCPEHRRLHAVWAAEQQSAVPEPFCDQPKSQLHRISSDGTASRRDSSGSRSPRPSTTSIPSTAPDTYGSRFSVPAESPARTTSTTWPTSCLGCATPTS